LIITIKVQPRASKPGVEQIGEEAFKVRVHAPPEGGRANAEVIALLAGYFDVPRAGVRILRGSASRLKTVSIEHRR
jgi:uncharacterized protein (TIGR00251 family)